MIYNMNPYIKLRQRGFTIVELLIVIVVLGVLGLLVLLAYPSVQVRVRNTSMVAGVKEYVSAVEAYHATIGDYPKPPAGFSDADRAACLGENYVNNICLVEDVLDPNEVTNKAWLDTALKQLSPHLPQLPINVKWNSDGHQLEAGAAYFYTDSIASGSGYDLLLEAYGIDSATAVIAYYLEGNVPELCTIPGSHSRVFLTSVDATDKDITICVIGLGNVVNL
jgi:prepilin-type N-terminal cleavage/methylation domain-containing protein